MVPVNTEVQDALEKLLSFAFPLGAFTTGGASVSMGSDSRSGLFSITVWCLPGENEQKDPHSIPWAVEWVLMKWRSFPSVPQVMKRTPTLGAALRALASKDSKVVDGDPTTSATL